MQFTVKEMELLCVFHAGTLSATIEAVQSASLGVQNHPKAAVFKSLAEKLSKMQEGDTACLVFEVEK